MVIIIILVGYILLNSCIRFYYNLNLFEGQELELIWTILPALFLIFIAFPSLRLLYIMEEIDFYEITIKILGHQWFWSYEYGDLGLNRYDSYISEDNIRLFRLLNVDNCFIIPYNIGIRIIISRVDVIHSWTLPSLGVKVDAVPGRLNQLFMVFSRVGLYTGECSEICGANHSFIPVLVRVISYLEFIEGWWWGVRKGISLLN